MIEFLFLDLDDTILDFHKAERIAISKTIRDFGVEPTEEGSPRSSGRATMHAALPLASCSLAPVPWCGCASLGGS